MERSNDKLVAAFAGVLRDRRRQAGLTQEALAARADVSARFVSFLETGDRQPSLSTLAVLSAGLGIGMTELVEDVERRYRSADEV